MTIQSSEIYRYNPAIADVVRRNSLENGPTKANLQSLWASEAPAWNNSRKLKITIYYPQGQKHNQGWWFKESLK